MAPIPVDSPKNSTPSPLKSPDGLAPEFTRPRALNVPNLITLLRLVLTFAVLLLIQTGRAWLLCTGIFIVAVITDFLDGYLARKWNQVTPLGRVMDPFVDKVIIGGTLIFLTARPNSGVTPWLTFIVVGREMFITGLRSVLESHGVDFSAKLSGKLKMAAQSVTVPCCLLSLSPLFRSWLGGNVVAFEQLRDVLLWLTLWITLYSGIEYVFRAWRLMRRSDQFSETLH